MDYQARSSNSEICGFCNLRFLLYTKVSRLWHLTTVSTKKLSILSEICVYPIFRWKWNVKTSWIDERLKWPKECQIEGKTSTDFVNSKFLDVLWNAADIARVLVLPKGLSTNRRKLYLWDHYSRLGCQVDALPRWYPSWGCSRVRPHTSLWVYRCFYLYWDLSNVSSTDRSRSLVRFLGALVKEMLVGFHLRHLTCIEW